MTKAQLALAWHVVELLLVVSLLVVMPDDMVSSLAVGAVLLIWSLIGFGWSVLHRQTVDPI